MNEPEAEERLRVWCEAQTRGMAFTDRQAESFDALRSDYRAAIAAECERMLGFVHQEASHWFAQSQRYRAALDTVIDWLDTFYDQVEHYDNGERGMTQFDHGSEEYIVRMTMADIVRATKEPR